MHLPVWFFLAAAVVLGLLVEAWFKRREPWALPAAFLYLTIAAWYFADLFINPDDYEFIPRAILDFSYGQVIAFLAVYRLLVPWLSWKFARKAGEVLRRGKVPSPEILFISTAVFWVFLLGCGVYRMDGDLLGALFPLDARAGTSMWQRAAADGAGSTGFLVATGNYIYQLVCASFGLYVFFLCKMPLRLTALALMLLVWPYFLLQGSRNGFVAVSLPFFSGYLLFARHPWPLKAVFLVVSFLLVDVAFKVVIADRNVGFRGVLSGEEREDVKYTEVHHQGLNMIQELCFTNIYVRQRGPDYGSRYLNEVVSVVPRVLWPSKPLLGIDYAVWRGYEGGDSDIGVVATISSGMIGGGVLSFGSFLGPLVPAALMAVWTALLSRWWLQRASLLRTLLYLVGLGLTFNLGRDITSLVLWPVVFGYVLMRLVESFSGSARAVAPRTPPARARASKTPPPPPLVAPSPSSRF